MQIKTTIHIYYNALIPRTVTMLPHVAAGDLADLIKVKDIDKKRLPWIIWVGPI